MKNVSSRAACLLVLAATGLVCGSVDGEEKRHPQFNREIQPLLAEHCFQCHGADARARKAGLRLDTEEGLLAELSDGVAAVVRGDRSASALYQRITATDDARMPPVDSGKTLSASAIERLGAWIDAGAPWEAHWAYDPPALTNPPVAVDWGWERSGIDGFILARLQRDSIRPSPEAKMEVLLRRSHLDLTGLLPTMEEVSAFLEAPHENAYERHVDRLLASPHFGEKWARWWLDLAAYADSDGYLSDFLRPQAWRYRQWVVEALNEDMPFDRFTVEQIAGDLLPDADTSERVATGFHRNTMSNREGGADLEEYRTRQVVDRVIAVGTVWLAQTFECAQCHDHKYDAISQREFYQFYDFFNSADEVNIDAPLGDEWENFQAIWPAYLAARAQLLEPVATRLQALQARWEERLLWAAEHPGAGDYHWDRAWEVLGLIWGQNQGEGQLEGTQIVRTPVDERSFDDRMRLQDYFLEHGALVDPRAFAEMNVPELVSQLTALKQALPRVSRAPTLRASRERRHTYVLNRGDFRSPGERVVAGTPAVLHPFEPAGAPDRLDLAYWLVDTRNPLVARVLVNRLWQELFGRGVVRSSEDFGIRGDPPSHPELLDRLALELVGNGWSIKSAIRSIVMSATYRQRSHVRPEIEKRDPENVLLARQTRKRLSAELVRDSVLAASGLLDRTIGGPSVRPPQPESVSKESFDVKWEADEGANQFRRGLYTFIQRTSPYGQYVNFDFPETNRACTRRERSNTPLQALNLLNDENFFQAARALAGLVLADANLDPQERIRRLFVRCFMRSPATIEQNRMMRLLASEEARLRGNMEAIREIVGTNATVPLNARGAAWVIVSSVALNLDEFITRE